MGTWTTKTNQGEAERSEEEEHVSEFMCSQEADKKVENEKDRMSVKQNVFGSRE